ncbi:hypothetical protein POTOM_018007 [Populus tomentosa]|uniref:Rx N-terminal domain-containing protein n=1 Tax=Populus tomentosa TaxID=118781 RepID=A0A8X8A039_POPTO|nr:hypothetical protein POTOM_018007 [Populus tomentosa]
MAIGEIFLAAFLGVLFTRLTSPEFLKFARREGIWKKADKWRHMLSKVQEVLDDAEEKQLTEKAVKIWLDDLRDLAYDVEDLLDEFATESLRRAAIKFNPKMRSKMKEASSRLEGMAKQRTELGLEKMSGGRRTSTDAWQKPPSASVPNELVIYGRDGDKKKIIDLLLTEEASHDETNFQVVPIVDVALMVGPPEYHRLTPLSDQDSCSKYPRELATPPISVAGMTLLLKGCRLLEGLPSKLGSLINLRHLDITNASSIKAMPMGIEKLTNLQTLSNFVMGKDKGSRLSSLANLKSLRGTLCITGLENVIDAREAMEANIKVINNLEVLLLEWSPGTDSSRNEKVDKDVLDDLRPHGKVKELTINCYAGLTFPTWLVVSIHSLPKLCKMAINGCKEVVYEGGVYLRSLNSMTISNISKLTCLTEGFIQPLAEVQELEVANCMEMASLYENGAALAKQLTSLSKLVVRNCPQVVSLMEGEVPVYMQQQLANCKLESLTLSTCKSLKKLPRWVHSLVSLKELKIRRCPRLLSFPEAGLPFTLRIIEIVGCNALTPLPAAVTYNIMCLEQLHIDNCDSLMSLGRIQLSQTVKKLEIRRCKNLLCLLDDGEGSSSKKSGENTSCSGNNSSLLEYLYVEMCISLTSIGELPSALKYLQVRSCSKLKSLSSRDKLPAGLKHLAIKGCENLESMPDRFQDNMSLEHISIRSCFNLRSLPEGLHKLFHLREISIGHCPALVSFAAEGLPINLRRLFIMKCDRLKAIPEEGFPTSLTVLATIDLKICELLLNWGMHKLSALRTLIIQGGCSHISFPSVDMGVRLVSVLEAGVLQNWQAADSKDNLDLKKENYEIVGGGNGGVKAVSRKF